MYMYIYIYIYIYTERTYKFSLLPFVCRFFQQLKDCFWNYVSNKTSGILFYLTSDFCDAHYDTYSYDKYVSPQLWARLM